MLRLFIESQFRLAGLTLGLFLPRQGEPRPSLKRLAVMLVFIPLFALVQLIHWLGLFLDELLFPAYRRVEIREPLIVLGVPRSGTTHLHRVLARDDQYTTFSTWECLFALSITARRFWLGIAWLDAKVGAPLARMIGWLETHLFKGMTDVHSMSLTDPEEDYFSLMPVLACFILALPFSHSEHLWRMGAFDRDMPDAERRALLDFYYRALQRHLYAHGPEKRLLSKNAAFAPLAGALAEQFPDARFLVCLRDPIRTIPSQLSSIEAGVEFFDACSQAPDLHERLVDQLGFYYRNLEDALATMPEHRCVWVTMETLKADLFAAIEGIYGRLGLDLSIEFSERLRRQAAHSRRYRSEHSYELEQFGLSREDIEQTLGDLYAVLRGRAIAPRGQQESVEPAVLTSCAAQGTA